MALHRKQRGIVDVVPQYVRIPASRAGGRGVGYSVHETHPPSHRVYSKRFAPGDRPRKMSSLQLRVCFVLCVLMYFGAIYFADDIASLGRVVGSEQNSQNFFVHSLMPRGRGHVRVGRAVEAKKVVVTTMPTLTVKAVDVNKEQQQLQGDLRTEVPEVGTMALEAEERTTGGTAEVEATEQPEKSEVETNPVHRDTPGARDGSPGDGVHPDDQNEGALSVPFQDDKSSNDVDNQEKAVVAPTMGQLKSSEAPRKATRQKEQSIVTSTSQTAVSQPHPTAALRHPEKGGNADTIPAARAARGEAHHVLSDVDGGFLERQAIQDRKPISKVRIPDLRQRRPPSRIVPSTF